MRHYQMIIRMSIYCVTSLFVVLTLIGCSTSKTVINDTVEPSTMTTTQNEVPTPDDQMALAIIKVEEEMRIFDVEAHHEALYHEISSLDKSLTDEAIKATISVIVKDYMDAYFLERIGEILSEYNQYYTDSDVETLFDGTSRTSLYALIELYEWSFYNEYR